MRKLASIQKIVEINPIDGADKIETAQVLGWSCVTQKSNNFKPGDLVCYFEIDSMLPLDVPQFEFLRKKMEDYGRIKTIKLRGQFSQGLILPLGEILAAIHHRCKEPSPIHFAEGMDLTELLGVKKYELPDNLTLAGDQAGLFPGFISKSDETRIQAVPGVLARNKGLEVVCTEKIDGSSITVFYTPKNTPGLPTAYQDENLAEDAMIFGLASRNYCLKATPGNRYWTTVQALGIEDKLKSYGRPIALQGEMYGAGVQGNKLQLDHTTIRWYKAVDPVGRKTLSRNDFLSLLIELNLLPVPDFGVITLPETVAELVKLATRKSVLNPNVWAEGIVVRPPVPFNDRQLGEFSFKVINPEFSLKYDE